MTSLSCDINISYSHSRAIIPNDSRIYLPTLYPNFTFAVTFPIFVAVQKALKPVEQTYLFHEFFHPLLRDSDFDAAPILLLCGQYSTGKTSFIKYLLQRSVVIFCLSKFQQLSVYLTCWPFIGDFSGTFLAFVLDRNPLQTGKLSSVPAFELRSVQVCEAKCCSCNQICSRDARPRRADHPGQCSRNAKFVAWFGAKIIITPRGNFLTCHLFAMYLRILSAERPFTALTKFGSAFLNKLECAQMKSKLLEKLTIVDTPGVLAGEKQRMGRSYDYTSVMEWFAERSDRILLLFDAHKLDISDEFKRCLLALKG